MINSDLLNSEKLDENFSGAIGSCGLPPTCLNKKVITTTKRSCTKVLGRNVCVNKPFVKTETNQACIDSKSRYKKCVEENRKNLQVILRKISKMRVKISRTQRKVLLKTSKIPLKPLLKT